MTHFFTNNNNSNVVYIYASSQQHTRSQQNEFPWRVLSLRSSERTYAYFHIIHRIRQDCEEKMLLVALMNINETRLMNAATCST